MIQKKLPWYYLAFRFVRQIFAFIFGLVYFVVYVISYILSVIARVILGISYFGLGDIRKGGDIFRFMFRRAPWDK